MSQVLKRYQADSRDLLTQNCSSDGITGPAKGVKKPYAHSLEFDYPAERMFTAKDGLIVDGHNPKVQKCVFHTESMLPVTSQGAYNHYCGQG